MSESLNEASVVRTPNSEVHATLEVLATKGVKQEHLGRVRSDIGYANRVAAALIETPVIPPVSDDMARLIPPPAHMLADLRGQLAGEHGFKAEQFDSLTIPRPPLGNFPVVAPVAYLETLEATMRFYWQICQRRYAATWAWPDLKLGKKSLRVWSQDGNEVERPSGTVRMVGLDLFAYYDAKDGTSVADNRAKENAPMPGVEILALMALAPVLGQAMDGGSANGGLMPWLDLPGLEASVSGSVPWSFAPFVRYARDYRKLQLNGGHVDNRCRNYASPAFRECTG
ncbi:MAG: hypothetical protein AAB590_00440 [Patescibacteria group bacterium]